MRSLCAMLGSLLLVVATAACGLNTPSRDGRIEAQQELTALERAVAGAAGGDLTMMERVLANDFVGIEANGQQLNRQQVLERLHIPDYQVLTLRHDDIRVHVFGECAVATATTVLEARYKGQEIRGRFPYTRVWLKRAGKWQAVFTQSAPPRAPQDLKPET